MKKGLIIFLQIVLVFFGIAVLAALLWEPHIEGVNANAIFFEVYLDPFIACVYLGAVPFFVALYKVFRLLGYAGKNNIFSQESVRALRTIKYCALITSAAIVAVDIYIRITMTGNDDPAGALMLGMVATFTSIIIATIAAVFEKMLQNAVDIKSENDLTV